MSKYIIISLLLFSELFAQKVQFSILQFNDIYETGPLSGGKEGGAARVAEYRNQLLKSNNPLITILAGDFLSPSVMNDVVYEGKKIKGRQMVELLNSMEVDLVTFGNHEFDLKEADLLSRINESNFEWISSNVLHKTAEGLKPFEKVSNSGVYPFKPCTTLVVQDKKGHSLRVGFIGITLQGFKPSYAEIESFTEKARQYADTLKLRDAAHLVLALSHLNIEEDRQLAQAVPELRLIMGGHEHEAHIEEVGSTRIAKADANVRSIYVHTFKARLPKDANEAVWFRLRSKLVQITDKMKESEQTAAVDRKWKQIAFDSFRAAGFKPEQSVMVAKEPLNGLESSVRNQATNLGQLVAAAYKAACPNAQAGILNSGSIRIDDQISGVITEYDVLRILPFGGQVVQVEMKGSLLRQFLNDGLGNKGSGGYLQYSGVAYVNNNWTIQNQPIQDAEWYPIAVTDFLLTGKEKNMGYLKSDNESIRNIVLPGPNELDNPARDVRIAVIQHMRTNYK